MCFSVPIEISHSNVIVICCLSHLHLKSKEFGHLDTKDCEQTIIRLLSLGEKKNPSTFIYTHTYTNSHNQTKQSPFNNYYYILHNASITITLLLHYKIL